MKWNLSAMCLADPHELGLQSLAHPWGFVVEVGHVGNDTQDVFWSCQGRSYSRLNVAKDGFARVRAANEEVLRCYNAIRGTL
jgi:hypothetical protein